MLHVLFSCFSVSYNKGRHGFAPRKAHHFSAISLFLNIWFRVWIQESLFICWQCWSGHSVVFLGKTLYFHSTSFLGIEPTNYFKKLTQGNKRLPLKCQGNLSKFVEKWVSHVKLSCKLHITSLYNFKTSTVPSRSLRMLVLVDLQGIW